MSYLDGKRILITGVCGTVGSELARQLLTNEALEVAEVIGVDNNESELFFTDQRYLADARAGFYVGDVRDIGMLTRIMKDIDIVFHAAALKHVVLCERSPYDAVQTNIEGVQNVIQAASENNVEKVIFTSSDKAVNPTNVMGTSKLMGERLMTAANSSARRSRTVYASTRFGNVLGSNGSVIPIFARQIQAGGPVTVTDEEMTRFVMSIEEAVRLVIDSAEFARGGEVFITKMPIIRIVDLAAVMIEELAENAGYAPDDIKVTIIGTKPGEKLYEELMSDEETRRACELTKYFAVLPAFRGMYRKVDYDYSDLLSTKVNNAYVSANETPMTREELRTFLRANGLLMTKPGGFDHPDKRYWPGDKAGS